MLAMDTFLDDFDAGKQTDRYIAGALSSHFLFLYSAHFSAEFHLQALQEMLRVADEVRIKRLPYLRCGGALMIPKLPTCVCLYPK